MKKAVSFVQLFVFSLPMFAVGRPQVIADPEILLSLAKQAMKNGKIDKAAHCVTQAIVGIRMAGACCADATVHDVKDVLTRAGWTHDDNASLRKKMSHSRYYHIGIQQVEHFKRAFKEGTLPSPRWIGKYRKSHYYAQFKQTPTESKPYFLSDDVCKIIQGVYLEKYTQLIAEANQKLAVCSCT